MSRCLVIGNGPSLADIPNEFLCKYPSFGSNRVYLKFVPDYYACVDRQTVEHGWLDEVNDLECVKYIDSGLAYLVKDSIPLYRCGAPIFSKEPLTRIRGGWTATYVLLQLAYWMDFEQVGLIGVDHRYNCPVEPGRTYISTGTDDKNHFSSAYHAEGSILISPELEKPERSYRMAREAFDNAGRQIVNLTPDSALDIFDKEDWHTW